MSWTKFAWLMVLFAMINAAAFYLGTVIGNLTR